MPAPNYRYIVQCLDNASASLNKRRQLGAEEAVGHALNECGHIINELREIPLDSPVRAHVETILEAYDAPIPPDPKDRGGNFVKAASMGPLQVDALSRAISMVETWALKSHNQSV